MSTVSHDENSIDPDNNSSLSEENSIDIAQKIKSWREQRHLPLSVLSHQTRISEVNLKHIESGAWDLLPGQVFGRGFIRNIGRTLGIDPSEIEQCVTIYEKLSDEAGVTPKRKTTPLSFQKKKKGSILKKKQGRWIVGVSLVAMVLLAIFGGVLWMNKPGNPPEGTEPLQSVEEALPTSDQTNTVPDEETVDQPGASESQEASVVVEAPQPVAHETANQELHEQKAPKDEEPAQQTLLAIRVLRSVEVNLRIDQLPEQKLTWEPGEQKLSYQDSLSLRVSDAGALQIIHNGESLGAAGQEGKSKKLSFYKTQPAGLL